MNYILRHTGTDLPDTDAVKKVLEDNDIKIIDSSSLPKMALLDGIVDHVLPGIKKLLPDWEFFPQHEAAYAVPDARRKVLQKKK